MIKVAIVGSAGRMGRILIEGLAKDAGAKLSAAIATRASGIVGVDAGDLVGMGSLGVKVSDNLADYIDEVDAVIDFTRPDYTIKNAILCSQHQKSIVIGTTGLNAQQKQTLQLISEKIPIVFAPNMSIGVNLVFKLLEMAAKVLDADADVEIIEAHHRNKKDAPSGTALRMGEVIANATNRDLEHCAVYSREGHTNMRGEKTIGFATIRAGDIVGDHTALFACEGELIEITHKSSNRMIYARGAIKAVKFLSGKQSGLYDMQNVLGLS
ncbi:MAG: 4-hydroxy-tetrahydrodipicolinate reductase [Candidatus Endonucleobacter bathymodioli]|uniref:4-hydroxy-tetrahydrodipicolinate reductase n=1 Tax=Candidatus Endonucleibacter bathymodioli TaxID=539814 RepID=A0AA90P1D1_9GAMM|nr:4-hydroxy-tetrahydrodipicolinate reductase [Candidatus Endonucleobacter bathymodioli]